MLAYQSPNIKALVLKSTRILYHFFLQVSKTRKNIKEKVKKDKKISSKYAGEYFDEDGDYVIMIADDMVENENSDICQYAEENNIEIVEAKYTYDELENIYDIFSEKCNELLELYNSNSNKLSLKEREALSSIQGYGIDEINNCVVVECSSIEYVECLKEMLPKSDIIKYVEEGISKPAATITISGGRRICTPSKRLSIGYRAYCVTAEGKYKYGFVTAGHGVSVNEKIYADLDRTKLIGKCLYSKYSGNMDAAFVEISSPYVMSNKAYYSSSWGSTDTGATMTSGMYISESDLTVGMTITKSGFMTYLTTGKLLMKSYTANYKNSDKTTTSISGLVKVTTYVKAGDSGGLTYTYLNGKYCVLGVVSGAGTDYSMHQKASVVVGGLARTIKPY